MNIEKAGLIKCEIAQVLKRHKAVLVGRCSHPTIRSKICFEDFNRNDSLGCEVVEHNLNVYCQAIAPV